jgi:hypothetical protein
LVVLLDLLAIPVALLDILPGTQGLLALLAHRDLPGLPENLACLVFLKDRKEYCITNTNVRI